MLVKTLDADLVDSRGAAAQHARDLAAEQGRRETLELQQIELRRSLESVIAAASERRGALARKSAKAGSKQRAQSAGAKTSK